MIGPPVAFSRRASSLKRQAPLGVATIAQHALGVLDVVGRHFPELGGALDHLSLDVVCCLIAGPPRLEGGAAPPVVDVKPIDSVSPTDGRTAS